MGQLVIITRKFGIIMNIKACLSKNTDNWRTPKNIYNYFVKYHGMKDCFPYQATYDEFQKEYDHENLFVNPPFSKMKKVAKWVWHQVVDRKCNVYLLIPARTDTAYFHELLNLQPEIIFIRGRLSYNDIGTAPFPTILMIFTHPDGTYPSYRAINRNEIERI